MIALLDGLSLDDFRRLDQAGEALIRAEPDVFDQGGPVLLLAGDGRPVPFRHYPEGDVYDFSSHAQFYYHVHRTGEHGHIHLFLRPRGMPPHIRPVRAVAGDKDAPAHLIALGLDASGHIAELFTTNRWVTGEAWYDAGAIAQLLPRFRMAGGRHPAVARWLTAAVALFAPLIADLARRRDRAIEVRRRERPGIDPFEDDTLEVTSRQAVTVEVWRSSVAQALKRQTPPLP